jgi:hypothetical protein
VFVILANLPTSKRVLQQKSVLLVEKIVLNVIPIAAKLVNKAFGYKTRRLIVQLAVKIASSVTLPQDSVRSVLRDTQLAQLIKLGVNKLLLASMWVQLTPLLSV